VRRWKEIATDKKKVGYCSTGQNPQRAVVLVEEDLADLLRMRLQNNFIKIMYAI
jgi:hypothetical protein